jgi:SSS family solute:Na+ symporter
LTPHLVVLISYSLGMITLGVVLSRRVRSSNDFFVAGRQLGPGLIFSTMLAANIGAGSTVGATALGYSGGIGAWWWVGSAAIGSLVLALWIGPSIRRVAAAHNLQTVGDYLEFRYSTSVRGVVALLLWVATLFILAGQLVAIGSILEAVAGIRAALGCAIGGVVVMAYFAAGGLLTTAWVNVAQLTVKLAGFALALPIVVASVGGWTALFGVRTSDPAYWSFWQLGPPGVMYVALLTPSFIISPGLLQKVFGARDDRAVRLGVGLNALGLFLFAGVPVVLGIVARAKFPDLASPGAALPMILVHVMPPAVGAVGLAAVFSAEISASDAALFMLTTSLSRDLYKRFVNPAASDQRLLFVARVTTVAAATLSIVLGVALGNVVNALTIFYTLLGVSLFVPILAGLYLPAATTIEAMASIACGTTVVVAVHAATLGQGVAGLTPAFIGILSAVVGFLVVYAARAPRRLHAARAKNAESR